MSTRPPKPSKYHSWSREERKWLTQGEVSWRRDRLLEEHPSEYFDIEAGLDSPPLLLGSGTGAREVSLNALQLRSGRPMTQLAGKRGHEWESLISAADLAWSGRPRYVHYMQLITSQEYELCRLGVDRRASTTRAVWALHAQFVSERDIAAFLGITRHEVRCNIKKLHDCALEALDNEN